MTNCLILEPLGGRTPEGRNFSLTPGDYYDFPDHTAQAYAARGIVRIQDKRVTATVEAEAGRLVDMSIDVLKSQLKHITNVSVIRRALKIEVDGHERKGAVAAFKARLKELKNG